MSFNKIHNRRGTKSLKWDSFSYDDVLPMWVADTDFQAPEEVLDAMKKTVESGIFGYTLHEETLKASVINWMKRKHGWSIDEKDLLFSPGVINSISVIISSLTEIGDGVVIQPPVYPPFADVITRQNRNLLTNPLKLSHGIYTIDFEGLEDIFATEQVKLLIFCSPHNPVGRVWTKEELERLASLCLQYNVTIIADEIHHDLVFEPNVHTVLATISKEVAKITITCAAPSKTFNLAGLQSSIIVTENKEYYKAISDVFLKQGFHRLNMLANVAFEAAYNNGDNWLEQKISYVKENVALIKKYFEEHYPTITWVEPEGTYLLWIDISSFRYTKGNFKEDLQKEVHVVVEDGAKYGAKENEFIRINLGCPKEYVEEFFKRFSYFVSLHVL